MNLAGLLAGIHGLFTGRNCCPVRRITYGYPWPELEGKGFWYDPRAIEVVCLVFEWLIGLTCMYCVWHGKVGGFTCMYCVRHVKGHRVLVMRDRMGTPTQGSYNITYRRDYLVDYKEYDGGNIMLGDGRECRVWGTGEVQVQMRNGSSFVLDNSGKIKVIKGSLVVLSGTKRANCVYTLDGQAVTRKTLKEVYTTMYEEDHAFEVEPQGNVDHVAGSQEIQTQDLMDYHSVCDREQHSACELFGYREDSNEAAFAVGAVDKIYAHELLTFDDTVACEVISKWKAALKEDMDARSDVYVLSNGCRKSSDDRNDYYLEYTPAKETVLGMKIVRDQSGNTLRVSQFRFYNGKSVQTLLEGHFILSLEGSLSGDCDVEKNGKWSCIYVVGIQEYQMVCTRLDIAFEDVGMLDKFDRGLQTDVHVFVDFDYAMGRSITVMAAYMTLTEAAKEAIWLKGLAIESGFELKIVAGIATGALSKAIPSPRFQHWLKLLRIGEG
ncbi:hypothetical protein Tco_0776779 [Tanacetum coccineum]